MTHYRRAKKQPPSDLQRLLKDQATTVRRATRVPVKRGPRPPSTIRWRCQCGELFSTEAACDRHSRLGDGHRRIAQILEVRAPDA